MAAAAGAISPGEERTAPSSGADLPLSADDTPQCMQKVASVRSPAGPTRPG